LILGTRPEAIKMAPVVAACRERSDEVEAIVCLTGQHREMLDQVTDYFGIVPDIHLRLMQSNQTLAGLTARCVEAIDDVVHRLQPHCVVAQGDTTTVMAASLAAFYRRVPFVHVEAGLRTGNLHAPWPEELNRRIADIVAALYCAPTRQAAEALLAEGAPPTSVHVTGNTVVDALLATVERERMNGDHWQKTYAMLGDRPMVLITGHRRENFGAGFQAMCRAVGLLADRFPDCEFVYPVHLNPNVRETVCRLLKGRPNVHLIEPAVYPEFVWLMDRSRLILTDSGGVQEEAPSLRKPVLVMRETTERPEAVEAGAARLVGTSVDAIVDGVARLLTEPAAYASCQIDKNPYGDGRAAERILDLMLARGWHEPADMPASVAHPAPGAAASSPSPAPSPVVVSPATERTPRRKT
jgi:UDP-N-acetylglucosamine 2-epimerase (non-hydrolysing)